MNPYTATTYKGKPAILDTVSRVYYFGFSSMREARTRAMELNEDHRKNQPQQAQSWRKTK
jgi:hypothetical protein